MVKPHRRSLDPEQERVSKRVPERVAMFKKILAVPERLRSELSSTFRSLRNRDYRVYSIGQLISLAGTFMQNVAQSWVVYQLTSSALMLALVGVAGFAPTFLLSLVGGSVADRYDRRKVIVITQWLDLIAAAIMAVLFFTHVLQIWMILALAAFTGVVTAFEMPARQAYVPELVEGRDMVNVVSINSSIMSFTRLLGPALGAALLAGFGEGLVFALNALSYVAAIVTLHMVKPKAEEAVAGGKSAEHDGETVSIKDGLKFVLASATIKNVLIMTAFVSLFGMQFSILMPVFVSKVLHRSSGALGVLTAASALGSLLGALIIANRGQAGTLKRVLGVASIGVAIGLSAFALSGLFWLSATVAVFLGLSTSVQMNSSNALMQLSATDQVRGRIMSIYSMCFFGLVPIGSVLFGKIADAYGAPLSVGICAVMCSIGSLYYLTRK